MRLLATEESWVAIRLWHSIKIVVGVAHKRHALTLIALVSLLHHAAIIARKAVLCVKTTVSRETIPSVLSLRGDCTALSRLLVPCRRIGRVVGRLVI